MGFVVGEDHVAELMLETLSCLARLASRRLVVIHACVESIVRSLMLDGFQLNQARYADLMKYQMAHGLSTQGHLGSEALLDKARREV